MLELHALYVVLMFCLTSSYKILVPFPTPTNSHLNLGNGIVRNLLDAGHEVTYISPFAIKQHPKLKYINASSTFKILEGEPFSISRIMKNELDMTDYAAMHAMVMKNIEVFFDNEHVRKLLDDTKQTFDVIVAEQLMNHVITGLQAVYNCPFIFLSPMEPDYNVLQVIDEFPNPAYSTSLKSGYVGPLNFFQRAHELWIQITEKFSNEEAIEERLYEKVFGPILAKRGKTLPPFKDVKFNISLVLGNSHYSIGQPLKLPQNYIQVAGYHIDTKLEPLAEDVQRFLDNSKHGVIYFSMGSVIKSKEFPTEIVKSLLKMFGTLNENVIWKFEIPLDIKIPKNVMIVHWANQNSILAHPNCVLFITHGGLLSTTEAIHFGKPLIGIPVYVDQYHNIKRAVLRGFAKKVELSYDVANDVRDAIKEVLGNKRYSEKIKEISFIYHSRPTPPNKELVHWVEHVVKTNGAIHLRSPAFMVPWYQKLFLDLILIIVICFLFIKLVLNCILDNICKNVDNKKNN